MGAIFKREFKSYFTSLLGFIVVILYVIFGGLLFSNMFSSRYAQVEDILEAMSMLSFFLIPVLTMRLFSEERRAKTDQALLTAPVKITNIVFGKFFAALAVIGIVNGITLIYQFIFSIMVSVNWVTYLSCLLGTMLFSAALVAIGLFISALTENQMVAAIGSVATSLIILMSDTIASLLQSIDFLYAALTWASFGTRYNSFTRGLFSYADVAFFVSFTAIFLFLTIRIIEKRRWAGGSKEQGNALVAFLTLLSSALFGWTAVKQFISNKTNPSTTTFIIAIIFTILTVAAVYGCVWCVIKFTKIHSSRKKGTVIVKIDQKGEWKCPVCGAHNTDVNNFCNKCDIQRVANDTQAAAYVKPNKKRSAKYGAYSLVLTAVFVAVIVGLNIAASALSKAYPLTLDLTSEKDYSISEENLEYIKKITRPVTITVCADEKEYTDGTYASLLFSSGFYDMSKGMFFKQSALLLNEYEMRSDKVKVQFVDPQSTTFAAYSSKYPSETFSTGDILVECEFELDGKTVKHYRHLDASNLYSIENAQENQNYYQYYYYYGCNYVLSESNIETAVTSAIYSVTSDKTFNVALITANGGQTVDNLQTLMEANNYSFTVIDSLVTNDIPKNVDLAIIAAPTMDYSENDLKKLDDFLDLDGERGKNIIYIPDVSQGENVPNLSAFIAEWGFKINNGYAYATDSSTYYYSPAIVFGTAADSDYLEGLGDTKYLFLSEAYTAVSVSFEENEGRQTENTISLPESTVCYPSDADDNWTVEDAEIKGPFVAMGIATDTGYDEDYNPKYSRVMVIGGMAFINSSFNSESSAGNLKAILSAVNHMYDIKGETISFDPRPYKLATFEVTGNTSIFMYIFFIGIIPLTILITCIIVYLRRLHL